MSSNSLNSLVREKAANYFQAVVKGKHVMDFGGGTGGDLNWLIDNNYEVCFCEPSKAMRNVAIELNTKKLKSNQIHFLTDIQTDFKNWDSTIFPKKFDAVLADFCVFNCIDDITLLFSKLGSVLKPGGHIIAVLLDTTINGILKHYLKNFVSSFVKNKAPYMLVAHSGSTHEVYLHTPNKIKQALPKNFSLQKLEPLGNPGFMLLHLQKSEHANQ
jgi:SAM-dependent methyltransferase